MAHQETQEQTRWERGKLPPSPAHIAYFPVFLNLQGRRCVVIGTGEEVERKVRALREAGAQVTVLTPHPTSGLVALAEAGHITLHQRPYQEGDLRGAFLAISATTADYPLSRRIAQEAQREGVLLNVVDTPHLCTWIAPAIVQRGALTIAISTNGLSPALARFIRERLEHLLPEEWGTLLDMVALLRREVRRRGIHPSPQAWQEALHSPETQRLLSAHDWEGLWEHLLTRLTATGTHPLSQEGEKI
ncbi:MAG: bifunctional precorrin-2 dehydrogenase/sirohydrochlorin ferrochelatase [Dehalococcoidia bacterium]|nr:bifunctional precorrin-2 dehydrogenase/sirohydrochlorin ferrochelatase [Dehalococcoidia bacterium]MDW8119495.1 bifunctional precorrin-2 dehydrogenase/sirohydrochlorin ferrochelatase [Chloroflexota bacterium]